MRLKNRIVMITQEDFDRNLNKAVGWENIELGNYIACHRLSKEDPEYLWANEEIVREINSGKIELFDPHRKELTDCYITSFRGYGANWFLIKPKDYSGPKE